MTQKADGGGKPVTTVALELADRTGLIREAYRIEGISHGECRSIFLDWALKLSADIDYGAAITVLLAEYATPGHPMTGILHEALAASPPTGRRGGWRSRTR